MDEEREILAFPMDLTEYDASEMGLWNGSYTAGVVSKENFLTVKASGNMSVTLSSGLFYLKRDTFRSIAGLSQTALQFVVPTAHTSMTRYDAIGFRYDKNLETVEKLYRQGTPSQRPQIPAIRRGTVDADEIYVSYIEVPPGSIQIKQWNIHDLRPNETYCGYVRDGVERIPTQQFYDTWWSWFSALKIDAEQQVASFIVWMNAFKADNENELLLWIEDFKTRHEQHVNEWYAGFTSSSAQRINSWYGLFTSQTETDVRAWFQMLQDELNEHQAVNLANMIHRHENTGIMGSGVHGQRIVDGKLQVNIGIGWATLMEIPQGWTGEYMKLKGYTFDYLNAAGITWGKLHTLIEVEAE